MIDKLLVMMHPFTHRQKINISSYLFLTIVTALFVFCLVLHTPTPVFAQDKDKGQIIPSPKDFITKNLKEFNERLEELKKSYRNKYGLEHGSLLLDKTSPIEPETIAKQLPKPKTLSLNVQYPVQTSQKDRGEMKDRGEVEYYISPSWSLWIRSITDPVYNFGPASYSFSFGSAIEKNIKGRLVAADERTSQALGLPYKVDHEVYGDVVRVSKTDTVLTGCCIKMGTKTYCAKYSEKNPKICAKTESYESCIEYFHKPVRYYDKNYLFSGDDNERFGLSVGFQGVSSASGVKEVRFSGPGLKSIQVTSNRKIPSDESKINYRECISKYSSSIPEIDGRKVVEDGYKSLDNNSSVIEYTAVKFVGLGFLGNQIAAPPGVEINEWDYPDYFFGTETRKSYDPSGRITPFALLDFGDAGGKKTIKAHNLPVQFTTVKAGPFSINSNGWFEYRGGFGETHFRVSLGKYETVDGRLTANLINVVPDSFMGTMFKVSPGKNHKAQVYVEGPADMSKYQVKWTSDVGKWSEGLSSFRKVGQVWQTEAIFNVDSIGINKPVKIEISLVRMADNKEIYTYKRTLSTTYPPVSKLELFAGVGGESPQKVTGPIDLFFSSSNRQRIELSPRFFLKEGEAYTAREINSTANIEVSSSNPAIVRIVPENKPGLLTRLFAETSVRTGSAKVVAKMGDSVSGNKGQSLIANEMSELISNTVEISVNDAYLIAKSSSGGRTIYKLIVTGPANMSKYQARWSGEAARTTAFSKDGDSYVATLETTLRMDKVEIEKAGKTFANFNVKSVAKNINLKLIPPNPPVTVVKKVGVSDLGSLETITECKKNVSHLVEYFGFNPGMAVEDYCKADREKQKQEIKAEREEQKAFNKMLSDINKQGQDLVVVSDTMSVGAAIKGNFASLDDNVVCFWSLQNNANLELQNQITSIEKVGTDEGACFNIVKGLKRGFNPDTVLKVDLVVLPRPEVPFYGAYESAILSGTGYH